MALTVPLEVESWLDKTLCWPKQFRIYVRLKGLISLHCSA